MTPVEIAEKVYRKYVDQTPAGQRQALAYGILLAHLCNPDATLQSVRDVAKRLEDLQLDF